jgi:cellulose synthase/poly-beta-1,6-N-acetylglucosamine synthase-like glycosyltransferase
LLDVHYPQLFDPGMAGQRDKPENSPTPSVEPGPELADIDMTAVEASLGLHWRRPELSALSGRHGTRRGSRLPARAGAVSGLAGMAWPDLLLAGLAVFLFVCFAIMVAWRAFLLIIACLPQKPVLPSGDGAVAPVYTVLVALYREASAVPGLARAMCALDWPQDRLDLIILLESDDDETRQAVARQDWPRGTRVLVLPDGRPRTKPRALNYGLQYARGSLLVIYDAEDRPDPAQLRAAHDAFRTSDTRLACVQAPLVAYNHSESWLAGQWALEYRIQFGLLMPAQARLGLPLLLGGTSNHFRTDVLRRLHGWDAWNVTEDADLGVRLGREGYRADMIAPPTREEAPETLGVWTAQRSRWLKGFLQSWQVMMRRPGQALAELGIPRFFALQFGLAGTLLAAFVHAPVIFGIVFVALALGPLTLSPPGILLLVASLAVNLIAALAAPGPRDSSRLLLALSQPAYWPLQTLAGIRALYSATMAPHFWAKTPHGLTASSG